ncbi:MAG: DUF3394 domain-containing protein, partial [Pseudomonadota bacterium]
DFDTGEVKETTLVLPVGVEDGGDARLDALGLTLLDEDGLTKLEEPFPGTPYFETMSDFDFYADDPVQITNVKADADQLPKELIFIPALLLLGLIAFLQKSRAGSTAREEALA